MRCLFLDVASHTGVLALISDDHVLVMKEIHHRISDADLVPLFEAAMQEASWKPGDLTHLACVVGPGGVHEPQSRSRFRKHTGMGFENPGGGVHLSDLYATRVERLATNIKLSAHRSPLSASFVWLHSTKKLEIFVRGFGSFAKEFSDARRENVEELLPKLESDSSWTGELIPEHRELMENRRLQPLLLRPLPEILPAFTKNLTFTKELLVPWYGRQW